VESGSLKESLRVLLGTHFASFVPGTMTHYHDSLFVKPVVGVTDLFSITAAGVRNTATMFDPPDRGRARNVRMFDFINIGPHMVSSHDMFHLMVSSNRMRLGKHLDNSGFERWMRGTLRISFTSHILVSCFLLCQKTTHPFDQNPNQTGRSAF
jgi:hypothetical protein